MRESFWARQARDASLSLDLLGIIQQVAGGTTTVQSIVRLFSDAFGDSNSFTFFGSTNECPKRLYVRWDTGRALFLAGAENAQHGLTIINGWNEPFAYLGHGGSEGFEAGARQLINDMGFEWFVAGVPYYFAGHSMGGAVAQCMGARMRLHPSFSSLRCFSYGSPRPGGEALQRTVRLFENERFFNDNDPVRFMPPHGNEAPLLHSLLPNSLSLRLNQNIQATGGRVVHSNGEWGPAEDWPEAEHPLELSLAAWVSQQFGFAALPHGIPEYLARVQLWWERQNPPAPQPPLTQIRERGYEPTPAEQRRERGVAEHQQEQAIRNPQLPEIGPNNTSTDRYIARKRSGRWTVTQSGAVVQVCPGKRVAKRLARQWNVARRQLQTQAI